MSEDPNTLFSLLCTQIESALVDISKILQIVGEIIGLLEAIYHFQIMGVHIPKGNQN